MNRAINTYLWDFERIPLNKSHERSINRLLQYIEEGLSTVGSEQITEVELTPATYGNGKEFWLKVKTEYTEAKGSLLNALCSQHWYVKVGKRGSMDAHCYPDSYNQFQNCRRLHHSGCHFVKKD